MPVWQLGYVGLLLDGENVYYFDFYGGNFFDRDKNEYIPSNLRISPMSIQPYIINGYYGFIASDGQRYYYYFEKNRKIVEVDGFGSFQEQEFKSLLSEIII